VDKNNISQDDSILLRIDVNGGEADIDLSMIEDFKVISRGTSSSYHYINGKLEKKASYQYILIPLRKGRLKIPEIKATLEGETAFTENIVITVADQMVEPEEVKAVFSKASAAKNTLFTGEQTVFSLQFFTSRRLSEVGFERPFEFKRFSVKQFSKERTYTRNINGVRFNVTQVDYLITPSFPGKFRIDPAVLIANVVVSSGLSDSLFFSSNTKPVRVVSNPVEIEVLPLPAYDGEGVFSGLIGEFDIKSDIDSTNLKAGESATLTIKVSGTGNIIDANLPELNFAGTGEGDKINVKVYDDNPVEKIDLTRQGYSGHKIFKKAIVPVTPGQFEIKPLSLIYFNVDAKEFKKASTEPLFIDVTASDKPEYNVTKQDIRDKDSVTKKEVSLLNRDILEIKEGIKVLKGYREIHFLLFAILMSIPAVIFTGLKFFVIFRRKEVSIEKKMVEKAQFHYKKALKLNREGKEFLNHVYSAITSSILSKADKKGETVTIKETRTILKNSGMESRNIEKVTHFLEYIELCRFGGKKMDSSAAKDLLLQAKKIMKLICFAVICLSFLSFIPEKAAADSTAVFIEAVNDYKSGNFEQAAQKFEMIAQQGTKNSYLYYNIANAYLKSKDIGRAVLWYERAKKFNPGDPDLNFNLNYANRFVKDKQDDSYDIMEIIFFWDNLVPARIIQITAVIFSFLFFTWAGVQTVLRKKIFSGTGSVLFAILILTAAAACISYYKNYSGSDAVIVSKEAFIRSSISDNSTKLFTLHAGVKITVVEKRDEYLKIKFSRDKIGWVRSDQAEII